LQALFAGPGNRLGHRSAVLVGQLSKQPGRISLQCFHTFRTAKAHLEGSQEFFQLRQRGRTGMDVHGYPLFAQEDTTSVQALTKQY
jgi:hypothetical protein